MNHLKSEPISALVIDLLVFRIVCRINCEQYIRAFSGSVHDRPRHLLWSHLEPSCLLCKPRYPPQRIVPFHDSLSAQMMLPFL